MMGSRCSARAKESISRDLTQKFDFISAVAPQALQHPGVAEALPNSAILQNPQPITRRRKKKNKVKITKNRYTRLKKQALVVRRINEHLKKKNYVPLRHAKEIYGTALAHCPGTSMASAEILYTASIRVFVADVKFSNKENLDLCVPACVLSETTFTRIIE